MNNIKCSITKDGLILDLKTFRERELAVEASYSKSAGKIADRDDRKTILGIAEDERRHAEIVENLIHLVEKHYENKAFD